MGTQNEVNSTTFLQQMKRMASNWANSMADTGLARARQTEYQKLFEEVGTVRFEMGVTNAIRQHATGFFPSMAEFLNFVPTHEKREIQQCPRCEASGCGRYIEKRMVNGKFYDFAVKCDHKGGE